MIQQQKIKGYLLGIIAGMTYGTNPLFALPLYGEGMDFISVIFWRYALAIPVVAVMMKLAHRHFELTGQQHLIALILALLIAGSSLALFSSYLFMDVGIASTILFIYPVMVALIMQIGFGERLTKITGISLVGVVGGIWLLRAGSDSNSFSWRGLALVLSGALAYSLYMVGVNKSSLRKASTLTITFYTLLYSMVLFAVLAVCGVKIQRIGNGTELALISGLALLPTTVSFICTTGAVHNIGSTATAILGALEPLTAVAIGLFCFGEKLTFLNGIGICIVLIAVLLVISENRIPKILLRIKRRLPKRKNGFQK